MKKYTKAQRHEIYTEALRLFQSGFSNYLCICIRQSFDTESCEPISLLDFPEFAAKKPTGTHEESVWWNEETSEMDHYVRVRVMKECIEETKP